MTASQILGVLFLLVGTFAMALRREEFAIVEVASQGVLLLSGVSCFLLGAIFVLLGYLQKSVQT